jgi:hypothetical protein
LSGAIVYAKRDALGRIDAGEHAQQRAFFLSRWRR